MKESRQVYKLVLTERQAKLLSWACDQMARIIQGQDATYQDFMEMAWEKRCKEATGKSMDKSWDGGWYNMRRDAEKLSKEIKKRFWGLEANRQNGIHYDDSADVIWAMHLVLRHQLWKDRGDKSDFTVDADEPMQLGSEPLATINRL